MLEYERINNLEGMDVDKTNKSKECMLCYYWYFVHKNFSYGPYLCDGCHNMTEKSIDSKNIDIVYFNRNAYNSHAGYLKKKNDEKYLNLESTKEYESVWSEVKRLEKLRD